MGMKYNPLTGQLDVQPGLQDLRIDGAAWNSQIYNVKDNNTRKIRKALANTAAGVSNTAIACVGDSTTAGYNPGGVQGSQFRNGYPTRIMEMLNGHRGMKFTGNSWWNSKTTDSTKASAILGFDNLITVTNYGTGVTVDTTISTYSISGYLVKFSSVGGIAFAFPDVFDTIEFYYYQSGSTGTVDVNIDGGATLTTLSRNGTSAVVRSTLTGISTGSTHTINVNWASGTFYLVGVRVYLSTRKEVTIHNWGAGSMRSNNWSLTPANAWEMPIIVANSTAGIAADLAILDYGINDSSNAVPLTTFEAQMRYMIGRLQINGDVILKTPVWGTSSSLTTLGTYVQKVRDIAWSMDIPFIDVTNRWESATTANGRGFFNSDFVHPTLVGYADEALCVSNAIMQLM